MSKRFSIPSPVISRPAIVSRLSELIGNTPLFELIRLKNGSRLLLKLEQFNPTGSAKIRMAQQMLNEAEQKQQLLDGGQIVESTSGNTGMALALLAAERGYRFTAVVDQHASQDKLRTMRALGADLVFVSEEEGLATAQRDALAARMAKDDPRGIWTEQHNNPANANGYYPLAQELVHALGSNIDILVGAVGTGGSLFGTARALRSMCLDFRVIGVEPVGSIVFGGEGGEYYQSGTGTPAGAEIGALIDYALLDQGIKVSDVAAFNTARYLARCRALLVGGSAGGVIYHALRMLTEQPDGVTLVALVCDGGERYLDTIFNDKWMEKRRLLDTTMNTELDAIFAGAV